VAATAALFSPKVRGVLRQGAVYGLAGVLTAGDAIGSFVSGVSRGAQQAATSAASAVGTTAATAAATAKDAMPTTADEAADTLAAMANGETPAPTERRTRRARTEPTEGGAR
jgi:hypothetical protein